MIFLACLSDTLHSSEPRHRVSTGNLARPHPPREGARQQRHHRKRKHVLPRQERHVGRSSARPQADAGPRPMTHTGRPEQDQRQYRPGSRLEHALGDERATASQRIDL